MKKLLLIVVDACTSRVLVPAMSEGRLPNIAALAAAGSFNPFCSAIFPSITPAATSSIVTGEYPRDHGIAGAYWYDTARDEVAYFGDDFWIIAAEGYASFFEDFLVKLNHQRLRAPTLFQLTERAGLRAACLNYFIFRGDRPHDAHIPLLLRLMPGTPVTESVEGPTVLRIGDFITTDARTAGVELEAKGGALHRFGVEDDATARLLVELVEAGALPDFTLAYFPDFDYKAHEVGPDAAITVLGNLDERLGEIYAAAGGLDRLLADVCVIFTSDHSQSHVVADEGEASINLDEVLKEFKLAAAGEPWSADDQLMACPNMRVAQIYARRPRIELFERVVKDLLADARVDQVCWHEGIVDKDRNGYYVATAERGTLHFWVADDERRGAASAIDDYGCLWSWEGDLACVDASVSEDGRLVFRNYPNAFERLAGGLDHHEGGHIWATARPGYEFRIPRANVHARGGSHGSLHELDSITPLILAGAPHGVTVPAHPRTIDIAPLCLQILGVESLHEIGASRSVDSLLATP